MRFHLNTDFLIPALTHAGPERDRLNELAASDHLVQMSAIAWYEFCRGPRTPEQLAVARSFLLEKGIVPPSEALAERAAEVFRRLGQPRKRGSDIAIGVTATAAGATLLSRNDRDFEGIPALVIEAVGEPPAPTGP